MEIVACSAPLLAVCALASLLQFLEKFKLQMELTEKVSEDCFDATVMVCVCAALANFSALDAPCASKSLSGGNSLPCLPCCAPL